MVSSVFRKSHKHRWPHYLVLNFLIHHFLHSFHHTPNLSSWQNNLFLVLLFFSFCFPLFFNSHPNKFDIIPIFICFLCHTNFLSSMTLYLCEKVNRLWCLPLLETPFFVVLFLSISHSPCDPTILFSYPHFPILFSL